MKPVADPAFRFSVIVVSHKRTQWLKRCLTALRQLDHAAFEIIIVADSDSLQSLKGDDFKRHAFDIANISKARNLGVTAASGDICAFVDDDAVPEPMWLSHLEEAFVRTDADAVVGYVRGRNGISFQSRVASVDAEGETHEEVAPNYQPEIPNLKPGYATKLVGTNAAFRTKSLLKLGGFDEAFAFYLDDTDISLRLAKADMTAAVAPLAEVHHAFAPSVRRTALRTPIYLGDIGKSAAIFLRRHQGIAEHELFARVFARERKRLIRHMVQGTCEPRDIKIRLKELEEGWKAGMEMDLPPRRALHSSETPFLRVEQLCGHVVLVSRLFRRWKRLKEATKLADSCHRVSVFSFSLTPVRHLVRYSDSGVWIQ
ncbi:MAG: glycosyltransferase, partial [Paracoccaceae bacterium]